MPLSPPRPLYVGHFTCRALGMQRGIGDNRFGGVTLGGEIAQGIGQLARALNGDVTALAAAHETGHPARADVGMAFCRALDEGGKIFAMQNKIGLWRFIELTLKPRKSYRSLPCSIAHSSYATPSLTISMQPSTHQASRADALRCG